MMQADLYIQRSADFSDCRTWRYTLKRVWDTQKVNLVFVLLNPSTADEHQDDPTNRRGIGYAIRWRFGGVTFVNLFAVRTPHPNVMKQAFDPVGPDNDSWILKTAQHGGKVILAWGTHGVHRGRDKQVVGLLRAAGIPMWCMGLTKAGHPKHILYLKADLEPVRFQANF